MGSGQEEWTSTRVDKRSGDVEWGGEGLGRGRGSGSGQEERAEGPGRGAGR